MSNATTSPWLKQFGLDVRKAPDFFETVGELTGNIPQAHLLQRGFDDLGLDGILCAGNSPLVYFRLVDEIDDQSTIELYRSFWLHGGAPVLVLVSDASVNIYSGLTLSSVEDESAGLVTTLSRIEDDLAAFLLSVESGDFFHANRQYFNPEHRVDRALLANLNDTRAQLNDLSQRNIPEEVLDGLLCRLVFTAYLFDRGVIGKKYLQSLGIEDCEHLRDVLGIQPTGRAKESLYRLFGQLAKDFNGDLFAANLNSESKLIVNKHVEVLSAFFHGTSVTTGQKSFWPYDFGAIPIETISAIYEHFLKDSDKNDGAFYTPRFLAELVLDVALEKENELLGRTFLDPSCGSGIFLVGVFNRLAQEWRQKNPRARNNTIARELMKIIQESLFGVDINPTACRIAAFSLYLAYLDHLSQREIQELQEKGRALPNLVSDENNSRNLTCADFFSDSDNIPQEVSYVIGNPPWGSTAKPRTAAGLWCKKNGVKLPDYQISSAFICKAALHATDGRNLTFVLPAALLFNKGDKAVEFQRRWVAQHTLDCVLNLSDYRMFLFDKKATHPAAIVKFRGKPAKNSHRIDYWSPKCDRSVVKTQIIRIAAQDRVRLNQEKLLSSLAKLDAPDIWKRHFWASPRDRRFLDRLADMPRLEDLVRNVNDVESKKPWVMAVGFQPVGESDDPQKAKTIRLPSRMFVSAKTKSLAPVLLETDCKKLAKAEIEVRSGSNTSTEAFKAPLVILTKGFNLVGYSDFDVSFQDALRGISGAESDHQELQFLAGYLRSPLARYFVFHTSSNWGIGRPQIHIADVLRAPFIKLDSEPKDSFRRNIVSRVARITEKAKSDLADSNIERMAYVRTMQAQLNELVYEFFEVNDQERELINDTLEVLIPSSHPTRTRQIVPTIKRSSADQRDAYVARVCELLNSWSKRSGFGVRGQIISSAESGIGLAVFEKVNRTLVADPMPPEKKGVIEIVHRLRQVTSKKNGSLELIRGIKLFDRNRLYIVKTLEQRNWTLTSAMNDADEIAGTLLMKKVGQFV